MSQNTNRQNNQVTTTRNQPNTHANTNTNTNRNATATNANATNTSDPDDIKWGPHSSWMTCPDCNAEMNTRTYIMPGLFTHGLALILCGLWLCPFAPIPYCCNRTKDVLHFCNVCGAYIGAYEVTSC